MINDENYYNLLNTTLDNIFQTIEDLAIDFDELAEELTENDTLDVDTIEEARELIIYKYTGGELVKNRLFTQEEKDYITWAEQRFIKLISEAHLHYYASYLQKVSATLPDNNFGEEIRELLVEAVKCLQVYEFSQAIYLVEEVYDRLAYKYNIY